MRDELHKLIKRTFVGILFSDRVRRGTFRMDFVPSPHLIEGEIFGLLGESFDGVELSNGNFVCGRIPDYIKVGGFLTRLLKIACFEGKLSADAIHYRQSVVIGASWNLLPQFAV